MDTKHPSLRTLVIFGFRLNVALMAVVLLLWIIVGGFLAVLTQPYLLAALWFLGMVGLVTCASAYLNTFPGSDQGREVAHPLRAVLCLCAAAGMGGALWTQAQPAMANEPLGLGVVATALVGTLFLGCVLVILLSALILLENSKEKRATDGTAAAHPGMVDFSGQKTAA